MYESLGWISGRPGESQPALMENPMDFGCGLNALTDQRMRGAASCVLDDQETIRELEAALRSTPDRLEILQDLYKFHFYRGELHKAQDYVFQCLIKASIQGGFDHHWSELKPTDADWTEHCGPARSYLYALKALSFIRLRLNDPEDARQVLAALERLDPQDQVGACVIRDLLRAMDDGDD